jgi:NADH dehydrogenase [ubiquinone] 1 alpha subcomplex assembly factor 3
MRCATKACSTFFCKDLARRALAHVNCQQYKLPTQAINLTILKSMRCMSSAATGPSSNTADKEAPEGGNVGGELLPPKNFSNTKLGKGMDIFDDSMIDKDGQERVSIRGYGETSFQVNNVLVRQSVLLTPHAFLLWKAKTFEDITIESLSLFEYLYPGVEVVFIGCGERMPRPLPSEIQKHFRSRGIVIEATSTMNAAASFNILNGEGRNMCAALLTMQPSSFEPLSAEELEQL